MENNKLKIYKTDNWNKVVLDDKTIMEGHDLDIEELFSYLDTNYDTSVEWIDEDEWEEYFKYGK